MDDLRFELKFLLPFEERASLTHWLKSRPEVFKRAYPKRRVHNLYFDSTDQRSYLENLAGVSARTKCRLRWYGEREPQQGATFEVKMKQARLGRKETAPVELLTPFFASSFRAQRTRVAEQLPAALAPTLLARPQPTLLCGYERDYFVSSSGHLRVTLDFNHYAYDQQFCLRPSRAMPVHISNPLVVEVKVPEGCLDEARDLMREMPARLSRHSKFASHMAAAQPPLGRLVGGGVVVV